jgi:hypothetical protein
VARGEHQTIAADRLGQYSISPPLASWQVLSRLGTSEIVEDGGAHQRASRGLSIFLMRRELRTQLGIQQ